MIKYKGVSTLEVLQEANNYNKWIADSILEQLSAPVLEIGAGTGNLTKHFLHIKPLYITDTDEGLVKYLQKTFVNEKELFIDKLDASKPPPKKFQGFFSSIFAINVLEHIKDDELSLRNMHSMLKNSGTLILLVPAKKFAYTKLDQDLGHFRRYEKNILIGKLENNGFAIEKIYFFNIVGLLSWTVRNKVKRNNIHLKPYHIKIFDGIVPILRAIESVIPVPVGISLIVVAKKK